MTPDLRRLLPDLDRANSTPLFRQIADGLRERVEAGAIGPGERLPAIRALAAELGVNRSTVQMAYRDLESAGLVESRVGSGTRVRGSERPAEGGNAGPWRLRFTRAAEETYALLLESEDDEPLAEGSVDLSRLMPDEASFPVAGFRSALLGVLEREGAGLLSYGPMSGHPRLREVLARRLSAAGTPTTPDEVLVTSGAQQGIELCLRGFAEPGEAVVLLAPTYHQMYGILSGLGLVARSVPEGGAGPDFARLADELARPGARVLYAMPTFQNPTGRTWDGALRRRFLEATAGFGGVVLEDDFEAELRFAESEQPTLRALATEPRVVALGTVSKGLFPGARVGWIAGPREVVQKLAGLKRFSDLSSGLLLQAALAEFMDSGQYDQHLEGVRATLRRRHAAAQEALSRHLSDLATWTRPEGGYALWVVFPAAIESRALARRAREKGVAVAPGHLFDPGGGGASAVRLTVARADEEEIELGIARLARAARELSNEPTAPRSVFV